MRIRRIKKSLPNNNKANKAAFHNTMMEGYKIPGIKISEIIQSRDFSKSLFGSYLIKEYGKATSGFLVQTDESIDHVKVNEPAKVYEREDFKLPSGFGLTGNLYNPTLMTVRFGGRIPTLEMLFENRAEKNK